MKKVLFIFRNSEDIELPNENTWVDLNNLYKIMPKM